MESHSRVFSWNSHGDYVENTQQLPHITHTLHLRIVPLHSLASCSYITAQGRESVLLNHHDSGEQSGERRHNALLKPSVHVHVVFLKTRLRKETFNKVYV